MDTNPYRAAAEYLSRARSWTLTIEGEGAHPEEIQLASEAMAIEWAERLIRVGDYDLAEGEATTVRYHLRSGEVQVDRHVDVYRSEEEES